MIFLAGELFTHTSRQWFLILAKWSKYTYRTFRQALLPSYSPFCKIHNPFTPLLHQENATEKYQFSYIYLHLCVPIFNFSVSCSSEMQFCMIYLETWDSTQPYVAFSTLDYRSFFFVFGGTHTSPNSLTLDVWFLSWWFKRLHCLAYRILLLGQAVDWTVEWKIDINMNVKFEIVTNKSLQQNEGHLPVVPYCTNQHNERPYAFLSPPTDCI
jgi:hypothetical protein